MSRYTKRQPEKHKQQLLQALERSLGLITPACKEVGITRQMYYLYYNNDDDFRKAVDDINDITIDFVENQLFRKIKDGDTQAILFFMKYKGRKRGYTDTIDINSRIDSNIVLNVKNLISFDEDKEDDNDIPKLS